MQTLAQLFAWRVATTPAGQAYREYDASCGWVTTSWSEADALVARWAQALAAEACPKGSSVAILMPNGLRAVCMDQAALALGLVVVPLHHLDNAASIGYILADCDASVLLVADAGAWEAILATGVALPMLRRVVIADGAAPQDWQVRQLAYWLGPPMPATAPVSLTGLQGEDLAAIVYTSGTTGKPKGVMLTHGNVVSNVNAVLQRVAPQPHDVFLSFLPLSHTFERTAGYYLAVATGSCVAFSRSVTLLGDDLVEVRPTVLVSVPRIYERIHSKLLAHVAGSPLRARLFEWAQAVGWRRFRRRQGLAPDAEDGRGNAMLDALAWPLLQLLVARPLLARFGGRLRVAVSGGAPLSRGVARCFLGLGLPLLQGYGLTETSPVVAANGLDDNDPSTVGRVLPGVQVRIGDGGELQVHGPNVMRGYWKRPEDTARVLSADGWFATGDQAVMEQGRIRISGRLKEIIVTSTGEKVAPADLELAITDDPLFTQAFVTGEGRPFIACVVVLETTGLAALAREAGLDATPASLGEPALREAALARIRMATRAMPHYAVPRAVWLTLEPWTQDNGLMTPTLKLKRNNLATRFAGAVEGMYRR